MSELRNTFYAPDRAVWRQWLEENHAVARDVWLVYYKKGSATPCVSYAEAVEEALCFGWIDSRTNKLDEERYMQVFTPRKAKSPWSRLNKERVERLQAQGLITPAGLLKIEAAKLDGSWNVLDEIDALTIPADLAAALSAAPEADQNFRALSPSVQKVILWHIKSAKRPDTRAKRIRETVEQAARGKSASSTQAG